jgi:N-acetyl-anhydromuramyl-L-alanine amidase AmpD
MRIYPILQYPIPNFRGRNSGIVDIFVVHSMGEYIDDDNDPETQGVFAPDYLAHIDVGAHAFIKPNGNIYIGVDTKYRTPHAGKSRFQERWWLNDTSIGVEWLVEGTHTWASFNRRLSEEGAYTPQQYEAGAQFTAECMIRYPAITTDRITRHDVVSSDSVRGLGQGKPDPGPNFDWEQYMHFVDAYYKHLVSQKEER